MFGSCSIVIGLFIMYNDVSLARARKLIIVESIPECSKPMMLFKLTYNCNKTFLKDSICQFNACCKLNKHRDMYGFIYQSISLLIVSLRSDENFITFGCIVSIYQSGTIFIFGTRTNKEAHTQTYERYSKQI